VDVTLANERLFVIEERLTLDEIQQRAMDRRLQAFGGGLGALLQRPKPEEVSLVAKQRRLEPFWHVAGHASYVYERNRDYTIPASAGDVEAVTINGERYEGQPTAPNQRAFRVTAREHCRAEFRSENFTDGVTGGPLPDAPQLLSGSKSEITDPATLSADGTIAVPPEHRASFVVRQLMSEIMKPVQADTVLEEVVVLEATDLYYRPIWAFEFTWQGKGKQGIVEIDSVTGQVKQGKALVGHIKGMLNRDVLFDVGADTVGLFVPGGSIAVKLAKAAIDSKK
jgi:hypothetical protein